MKPSTASSMSKDTQRAARQLYQRVPASRLAPDNVYVLDLVVESETVTK
jgi:hypothetical protein